MEGSCVCVHYPARQGRRRRSRRVAAKKRLSPTKGPIARDQGGTSRCEGKAGMQDPHAGGICNESVCHPLWQSEEERAPQSRGEKLKKECSLPQLPGEAAGQQRSERRSGTRAINGTPGRDAADGEERDECLASKKTAISPAETESQSSAPNVTAKACVQPPRHDARKKANPTHVSKEQRGKGRWRTKA